MDVYDGSNYVNIAWNLIFLLIAMAGYESEGTRFCQAMALGFSWLFLIGYLRGYSGAVRYLIRMVGEITNNSKEFILICVIYVLMITFVFMA